MTSLIIADDDAIERQVPDVPVDVMISCGDIADSVILRIAQRCGCQKLFAVKGNHDSSASFPAPIHDLHLSRVEFRGLWFGGFCGSWKYKPRGNYLFEQDEVESLLSGFPAVDVFVAHNSPHHIHDRDDEVHHGFTAFNSYITRTRPRWFIHGHQHTNVESTLEGTKIVGIFGYRFLVFPD